jgi:hypothetical protein
MFRGSLPSALWVVSPGVEPRQILGTPEGRAGLHPHEGVGLSGAFLATVERSIPTSTRSPRHWRGGRIEGPRAPCSGRGRVWSLRLDCPSGRTSDPPRTKGSNGMLKPVVGSLHGGPLHDSVLGVTGVNIKPHTDLGLAHRLRSTGIVGVRCVPAPAGTQGPATRVTPPAIGGRAAGWSTRTGPDHGRLLNGS